MDAVSETEASVTKLEDCWSAEETDSATEEDVVACALWASATDADSDTEPEAA
jgi:hypothetical protein